MEDALAAYHLGVLALCIQFSGSQDVCTQESRKYVKFILYFAKGQDIGKLKDVN